MTDDDDPRELIAELRARVEAATREMDELVAELTRRRAQNDELDTIVDVLLGLGDTLVIVVDDERRIRGLSRAAADRFEAAAVGKPLSSAVSDDRYDQIAARLDAAPGAQAAGGDQIHPLPGGGAVLVLGAG
jgi:predicted phage gp36 major capsid-like protein